MKSTCGRRRADLMVWTGFALSLLMLLLVQVSILLPGSPVWVNQEFYGTVAEMQQAWESVFTLPGVLILCINDCLPCRSANGQPALSFFGAGLQMVGTSGFATTHLPGFPNFLILSS